MGVKSEQEVETLAFLRTQLDWARRGELVLGNILLIKSFFQPRCYELRSSSHVAQYQLMK